MLMAGIYRFRFNAADQGVGLKRFQAWTPPEGFTFQGHWARADGTGGIFVADASSAAAVLEAASAFSDLMEFEIVPVVDIVESLPISAKVLGWIGSVD